MRRGATAGLYVLLGLGYLLVSLWLQRRVLADPGGLLIGHVTADADMFAWWLHWFPFAVTHGENPLVTDWMHWPYGLNALWNTAVPLLALALAPVTLVAGSVTAFNVGLVLGPVVSGLVLVAALGQMSIQTVIGSIDGATFEPLDLPRVKITVHDPIPFMKPVKIGLGLFGPEMVGLVY